MATRVLGPTGSKRRKRFLLVPLLAVAALAMFFITSAQAVHDEGVFQLDGNALTSSDSTPTALEDWDLICKANRVQIGTLASQLTLSGTSLSITETRSPSLVPFNIQVESEQMTVTARTGSINPRTYTVTRGINGTTKVAHASGTAVYSGCLFADAGTGPAGSTLSNPSSFTVDPSNVQTDDILKGGTKDDNDINSWKWTSAGALDKNDLTNGYAAEYTCNSDADPLPLNNVPGCKGHPNDKLLYFGADRYGISGSANVAFWFFQKNVRQGADQADGTCSISSGCPFVDKQGNAVTHKAGDVSLGCGKIVPNVCTPGDILVISAFGPHSLINVYEWVGPGNATKDYLGTNSCFTAACSLQPLEVGGQECGTASGPNDNACAVANSTTSNSPWLLPQKAKSGNNVFAADASKGLSAFFEGGINLTGLGVGGACFSSFLINSRASAAGDAELHDKMIGSFQRCAPATTTQVKDGSGTNTNGTIQPGSPVHDTATITVTGASAPEDATGYVDFYLCGPTDTAPAIDYCSANGTQVGGDVNLSDTSSPANTTDGISGASSPDVNTSGSPLGNGYYCFRVEAHLSNYDNPDAATNNTTECFRVLKLETSILTDPQTCSGTPTVCVSNTGPFALADSTQVYDHAVVTGSSAGGFPEGSVSFYICNPSQVTGSSGSEICPASAGTQVGTAVTPLTHVSGSTFKSEATSNAAVTANQLGVWCFRAVYTSTSAVYNGTSGGGHEECFTVNTTSSGTTAQKWLPNDHVVVSTPSGTLAGKLEIKLYQGTLGTTCAGSTGTLKYTEPVPNNGAFTANTTGAVYNTTNSTFTVNLADANTGDYFWRIVFTPGTFSGDPAVFTANPYATGFTKCEKSSVSIDDSPSFP